MSTELMIRYFAGELGKEQRSEVEEWLLEHDGYRRDLLEMLEATFSAER
ncbi:MAG: hypothetical protein ACLFVQ_13410 [Chitinispirillaceae bacterium]